jgi:hypothetical protein
MNAIERIATACSPLITALYIGVGIVMMYANHHAVNGTVRSIAFLAILASPLAFLLMIVSTCAVIRHWSHLRAKLAAVLIILIGTALTGCLTFVIIGFCRNGFPTN